jgi:hypothetical protein
VDCIERGLCAGFKLSVHFAVIGFRSFQNFFELSGLVFDVDNKSRPSIRIYFGFTGHWMSDDFGWNKNGTKGSTSHRFKITVLKLNSLATIENVGEIHGFIVNENLNSKNWRWDA